eukprot:scaffold4419_cov31-Tisochrysis_lutea.AAC.9
MGISHFTKCTLDDFHHPSSNRSNHPKVMVEGRRGSRGGSVQATNSSSNPTTLAWGSGLWGDASGWKPHQLGIYEG